MAGNGPAPKKNRARRNAPARGDWVKLEPLAKPVLPQLGELGLAVNPVSALLWNAWRDDPVTQTWNASDIAFAVDTIALHGEAGLTKPNEVRLRMESLGLTPKGRRDLRLLLPDEDVPEEGEAPATAPAPERTRPAAV